MLLRSRVLASPANAEQHKAKAPNTAKKIFLREKQDINTPPLLYKSIHRKNFIMPFPPKKALFFNNSLYSLPRKVRQTLVYNTVSKLSRKAYSAIGCDINAFLLIIFFNLFLRKCYIGQKWYTIAHIFFLKTQSQSYLSRGLPHGCSEDP